MHFTIGFNYNNDSAYCLRKKAVQSIDELVPNAEYDNYTLVYYIVENIDSRFTMK